MAYPNLPSVQVVLNDLGLQVSAPPAGPKVTIFGACGNATVPLREPLAVNSLTKATAAFYVYNSDPTPRKLPSELALACDEAARGGAGNIEVVCIKNDLSGDSAIHAYLTGDARYADLTAAYSAVEDRQFDVVVPVNAHLDSVATTGGYGPQLANFCFQVTTEVDSSAVGITALMPIIQWAHTYEGDSSGTGDVQGLVAASTTLSGEVVAISDTNPLAPYYFTVPSTELVGEWAKYAGQHENPHINSGYTGSTGQARTFPAGFTNYLHGSADEDGTYYPTNDTNGATDVYSAYWTNWQAKDLAGNFVVDANGQKADAGSRISVVAAPLRTSSNLTTQLAMGLTGASMASTHHNTDGAAAYAGFVSQLAPHAAPTNKQIPALIPLRILSAKQSNFIAGRRLVPFHRRATGFVVSSAVTGAHNVSRYVRSDYVRLTTVRIVDAAVEVIRGIGDRYIGEPNNAAMRNAMSAEIDKVFAQMKVSGALNDYQFFISSTPDQQVLGEADVDLTLVPAFELTKISVNVSLAKEIV